MSPAPVAPAGTVALDDRQTLADLFMRYTRTMAAGHLFAGLVTAVLMHLHDGTGPWFWLAGLASVVAARYALAVRDGRALACRPAPNPAAMERMHTALGAALGMVWGAAPWLAHGPNGSYVDFFIAAMLLALTGAAVTPLSPFRLAFPAFAAGAVLPFSLRALLIPGDVYLAAALASLVLLGALVAYHRRAHLTLVEAIRLRRENRELVEELRAEQQIAAEASRVKALFLAGVSHDLRHPLHSVQLYLGYLRSLAPAEAAAGLERSLPGMEQSLTYMNELLTRLLTLARLDENGVSARRAPVALGELLARSQSQFQSAAAVKGLRLRCLPTRVTIDSDPVMLQSIIDNLVSNAVRYTAHGGVVAGVRRVGGGLALQVWDSGPGLPADRVPQLFEPYRRFDDARSEVQSGFGLGLALVARQCGVLGYRIEVKSRPGRGSLFSVDMGATAAAP